MGRMRRKEVGTMECKPEEEVEEEERRTLIQNSREFASSMRLHDLI